LANEINQGPYYVKLLKTFLREWKKTEKYFEGMKKKIPE
jgi:hypothetical protein